MNGIKIMLRFFFGLLGAILVGNLSFDVNMEERNFWTATKLLLQFDPVLQREQSIVLSMLYVIHEVHLVPTVE